METFEVIVRINQNGMCKTGKISSFLTKKSIVYIMQMLKEISVNLQKNITKVSGKQCLPDFRYHFLKEQDFRKK